MSEHTPTPWHIEEFPRPNSWEIRAANRRFRIASVDAGGSQNGSQIDLATAKENAEYIVQAANSHEELLEALKCARAMLRMSELKPANVLAQIQEAIDKAEGNQ